MYNFQDNSDLYNNTVRHVIPVSDGLNFTHMSNTLAWPHHFNACKGALDSQPQVIKFYQLLAQGLWFSPGTPASSTTKTGRHDIAEILMKVALNTNNSNSNSMHVCVRDINLVSFYDLSKLFRQWVIFCCSL